MRLSRRNFRIALLAFVAASLVVILFALDHVISHRRWPVKTLTDADRGRVVRDPVDTTVASLSSLPRVPGPLPQDLRIPPARSGRERERAPSPGRADSGRRRGSLSEARS